MRYWIKYPRPGEFRGEGKWIEVGEHLTMEDYNFCKEVNYLPVYEGEDEPKDDSE